MRFKHEDKLRALKTQFLKEKRAFEESSSSKVQSMASDASRVSQKRVNFELNVTLNTKIHMLFTTKILSNGNYPNSCGTAHLLPINKILCIHLNLQVEYLLQPFMTGYCYYYAIMDVHNLYALYTGGYKVWWKECGLSIWTSAYLH